MRIFELVTENLDEAIGAIEYEPAVEDAVKLGISQAATVMAGLKGTFPKEEKALLNDHPSPLMNKLIVPFSEVLAEKISNLIRVKLVRELGKEYNNLLTIKFQKLANIRGHADDYDIVISDIYVKKISRSILESLFNTLPDSYPQEEWVNATFTMFKLLGSQDAQTNRVLLSGIEKATDILVRTVIHELVHVIQHHKQYAKGRTDTEYRSYLDRQKGEFTNILASPERNASDDRYSKLYYASPQEIGAFAHEMALAIIKDYGIRDAKSEEELVAPSASDIIAAMQRHLPKDLYRDPANQKEYQVFKRYVKLIYQEVNRYIDRVRKTFKK